MESLSKRNKNEILMIPSEEIKRLWGDQNLLNKSSTDLLNIFEKYSNFNNLNLSNDISNDISNDLKIPKCHRCNALYCSKSYLFNKKKWKCYYCNNINQAFPGYIYTYFKDL